MWKNTKKQSLHSQNIEIPQAEIFNSVSARYSTWTSGDSYQSSIGIEALIKKKKK